MSEAQPNLILDFGDRRVTVAKDRFTLGRGPECDFTVEDDPEVSRVHVEISRRPEGGFEVRDAGSRNGIFVNETNVGADPVPVGAGDRVRFGRTTFSVANPQAETRLATGETRLAQPQVTLVAIQGLGKGTKIVVGGSPITVGRDESCDVAIDDEELSRRHARLRATTGGAVEAEDLDSRNGVFVAGRRISGSESVPEGGQIRIGRTIFSVGPERPSQPTRLAPSSPATPVGGTDKKADAIPVFAPDGAERPSVIHRERLERSARTTTVIAGLALVCLVALAIAAIAGVFSGGSTDTRASSEIVAEARPSTALVLVFQGQDRTGNGSAWVLDAEEGLIVTNSHVVDAGDRYQVGVSGDPNPRAATLVSVAPCDDLAVLRVRRTEGLRTLPLGSQSEVAQGDRVIALGFPGNITTEDELQVTEGAVSVVKSSVDAPAQEDPDFQVYPNAMQIDAAINAGNSGGPSINETGELIGVNTVSGGGQDQNFAIGVDRVAELVPQLRTGESIGWAGFGFVAASPQEAAEIGRGGLFVTSVVPGTGAAENDIFVGDYILEVNGTQVETRQDYCNAVETVSRGEPILIEGVGTDGNPFGQRVPFE